MRFFHVGFGGRILFLIGIRSSSSTERMLSLLGGDVDVDVELDRLDRLDQLVLSTSRSFIILDD